MSNNAQNLVTNNVYINVTHLIVAIIEGGHDAKGELAELYNEALELTYPIYDYESAALDAGWSADTEDTPEDFCFGESIEPYEREPLEFWAVSNYLANALIEHDEKVVKNFAGLNIWARCTSGQAIFLDCVIEKIADH